MTYKRKTVDCHFCGIRRNPNKYRYAYGRYLPAMLTVKLNDDMIYMCHKCATMYMPLSYKDLYRMWGTIK